MDVPTTGSVSWREAAGHRALIRGIALVGADTAIRRALAQLIKALGATVVCVGPDQLPLPDGVEVMGVVVLGNDVAAASRPDEVSARLACLRRRPLLVLGLGADASLRDPLADVTGIHLDAGAPEEMATYSFAADEDVLWPFAGLRLGERRPRVLRALLSEDRAVSPLISTDAGHVVVRLVAPGPPVYVSTASAWPAGPPPILRRSFCAESFLDTLPVMVFVRAVLAGRGWRRPTLQATCIVDDPNLRRLRYGHLDYRTAVQFARERPFHLSVGFVPLDYDTTSADVARLFRENSQALSLVVHGNDHLRLELSRQVPHQRAVRSACQALARMERHRATTGLRCPPVMTPPHGVCSRPWVRALRAAGYVAAVATATHPITVKPEDDGAGALHEMFCGELSLYGFPIITRFPAVLSRNQWLFAAWLGKPLVVYAHHGDFAGGAEELLAGVDFINNRMAPSWATITDIVHDNYMLCTRGRVAEVRAFSNDVVISVPDGVDELVVAKEGRDIPWESEIVRVDDLRVEAIEGSPDALRVRVLPDGRAQVRLRFLPDGIDTGDERLGGRARGRVRRALTETRDRLAPMFVLPSLQHRNGRHLSSGTGDGRNGTGPPS